MERDHLEDLGVNGRIILKCIFKSWNVGMVWIDLAQDKGQAAGFSKCGNEPSVFTICGEFLD
jgi:hypothetical protein